MQRRLYMANLSIEFWEKMDEIYVIKNHISNLQDLHNYLDESNEHQTTIMFLLSDFALQMQVKQNELKNII